MRENSAFAWLEPSRRLKTLEQVTFKGQRIDSRKAKTRFAHCLLHLPTAHRSSLPRMASPSALAPAAKRQKISREALQKRLQIEGVPFRESARMPALLALANEHGGLLTLNWPAEPQLNLLDLPSDILELILQKTVAADWRWHRQADVLFSVARC